MRQRRRNVLEPWLQNLPATSNALDADVMAQYRRCESDEELEQWLSEELTQLARTDLAKATAAQQSTWLKRLFANLRLLRLAQVGETAMMTHSPAAPSAMQAAQIEVLDILAAQGDWARLCALGAGTYEMLLHRLYVMAVMESTLTTSPADYVARFCTEHGRFSEPQAAAQVERNWAPLLLSLRQALKASPLIKKAVAPIARKSGRRERASSKQIQYPPVFSSWRERIVAFSCAFGLVFIGLVIGLGSPAWIIVQIQQRTKASGVGNKVAVNAPVSASATPTLPPTATPVIPPISATPEVASTPVATPTPVVTPTPVAPTPVALAPVATPTPVVAPSERAGFYVIGMAAREEANAQAEAQLRRQEGLQPRVVYSSNWSGLTPNYYQVVYGIFANRGDTAALRKDLEKRGIKTYVMHSGQRVRPL